MTGTRLDLCAVVLAGGQSRRMGGWDKGLLELAGVTLTGRVLARIEPLVRECLVSANRHEAEYGAFGHPVLGDAGWGPLGGLLAALVVTDQPWALSLPCDMPFFPRDLPQRLWDAAQIEGSEVAIPVCGQVSQHGILLCRRECRVPLADYLARGGRSVKGWLTGLSVARVEFDDAQGFINLNSQQDWAQAETQARQDERH